MNNIKKSKEIPFEKNDTLQNSKKFKADERESEKSNENDKTIDEKENIPKNAKKASETKEIDTMRDFLDSLKETYDQAHDEETKKNLAHHIIKLEMALATAGLTSDKVFVRETSKGILGYYDPEANQIAISQDQLENLNTDQMLYNTILVHEKTHKEGISDEGLTQKLVTRKITATPGIYTHEQKDAEHTFFHVGISKALELYEIDKPQDLVKYYLEIELEKLWKEKLESLYKHSSEKIKHGEHLEKISKKEIEKLEEEFEEGAPRLYKKLEKNLFDFEKISLEILNTLSKEM